MNIFRKIKATLRLREAMRQADKAHSETGMRYYVMPTSGTSGQLVIMNRNNFRKLKQKGYISCTVFVTNLERECFYCTPHRNGTGELTSEAHFLKRQQYFSWLEAIKRLKKVKGNEQVR